MAKRSIKDKAASSEHSPTASLPGGAGGDHPGSGDGSPPDGVNSLSAPWSAGDFSSALRTLVRKLRCWHRISFDRPFRTIRPDEAVIFAFNRTTFRDAIRSYSGNPRPRPSVRIIAGPNERESEGRAIHEPEDDADKALTSWLLAELVRRLELAPRSAILDFLRGQVVELLNAPAWRCADPTTFGIPSHPVHEDRLIVVGRCVENSILISLESGAERLLDPDSMGEASSAFPLPANVKNWLIARYLANPTPESIRLNDCLPPVNVVYVRFEEFAEYLLSASVPLLPNLDRWKNAGWIGDVQVELATSFDPARAPYHYSGRLNLSPGRHRLLAICQAVIDAPTEVVTSIPETGELERGKPPDEFSALRSYASNELKGQERAVIEALCNANGTIPIADLGILKGLNWKDAFEGFKNASNRLNPKLKPLRWKLERHGNAAKLIVLTG